MAVVEQEDVKVAQVTQAPQQEGGSTTGKKRAPRLRGPPFDYLQRAPKAFRNLEEPNAVACVTRAHTFIGKA